jgi:hypothetical protein
LDEAATRLLRRTVLDVPLGGRPGANYGRILCVKEGRDAAVLMEFLDALSQECADCIKAVAPVASATSLTSTRHAFKLLG